MKPNRRFFLICLGVLAFVLLAYGLLRMKFGAFLPPKIDENLPNAVMVGGGRHPAVEQEAAQRGGKGRGREKADGTRPSREDAEADPSRRDTAAEDTRSARRQGDGQAARGRGRAPMPLSAARAGSFDLLSPDSIVAAVEGGLGQGTRRDDQRLSQLRQPRLRSQARRRRGGHSEILSARPLVQGASSRSTASSRDCAEAELPVAVP